jgi:hypothetical protein
LTNNFVPAQHQQQQHQHHHHHYLYLCLLLLRGHQRLHSILGLEETVGRSLLGLRRRNTCSLLLSPSPDRKVVVNEIIQLRLPQTPDFRRPPQGHRVVRIQRWQRANKILWRSGCCCCCCCAAAVLWGVRLHWRHTWGPQAGELGEPWEGTQRGHREGWKAHDPRLLVWLVLTHQRGRGRGRSLESSTGGIKSW